MVLAQPDTPFLFRWSLLAFCPPAAPSARPPGTRTARTRPDTVYTPRAPLPPCRLHDPCRGLGKGLGVVELGLGRLVSVLADAACAASRGDAGGRVTGGAEVAQQDARAAGRAEARGGGETATGRSAGEGGGGGRAREFRVFVADDRVQRMSLPAFLARRCPPCLPTSYTLPDTRQRSPYALHPTHTHSLLPSPYSLQLH